MKYQIRRARSHDADDVFGMARQLATSFVVNRDDFMASFRQMIVSDHHYLLLAEAVDASEQVVGYLMGGTHLSFYANGAVGWVEELYVRDDCRSDGVGTLLMERFEAMMVDHGCGLVALATRRAESFYQAIGYDRSATYFKKHLKGK